MESGTFLHEKLKKVAKRTKTKNLVHKNMRAEEGPPLGAKERFTQQYVAGRWTRRCCGIGNGQRLKSN